VAWDDVLAALRQGNLVYLDHPYGSVFKSLQASLNALEPKEISLYLELAVFPEDTQIPVSVIAQLWGAAHGMDRLQVRDLLTRLGARSLLRHSGDVQEGSNFKRGELADTAEATIALHDLQHDFVRLLVQDLPVLHARLVDVWTRLRHQRPHARECQCRDRGEP
jgi:hypothetical protein